MLIALVLVPVALAQSGDIALAPQQGLLVLHNGRAIEGKISRAGDWWFVLLEGGQLRVPANQVELFCRDLQDGYQQKRAQLRPGQTEDLIQLTNWCLTHELFAEAQTNLEAAQRLSPTDGRVQFLQRRLQLATEPVEVAARTEPTEQPAGPTGHQLERFVAGLPQPVVAEYANAIQPLLIHRCSTGHCHGPQTDQKWQLLRTPVGERPRIRITQRNLYETLQQLAGDDVAESPLLVAARSAHGGATASPLGAETSREYAQLRRWAQAAAGKGRSEPLPSPIQPVVATEPNPLPPPEDSSAEDRPLPRRQQNSSAFSPRDPFDPEIFNRAYSPRQQTDRE